MLLRRAGELGRVLFSQDHDLLRIAHEWQSGRQPFLGVVFVHQHGASEGTTALFAELLAFSSLAPIEFRWRIQAVIHSRNIHDQWAEPRMTGR